MPRAEDRMRSILPRLRKDLFNDIQICHPLLTLQTIRMRPAAKHQRGGTKSR